MKEREDVVVEYRKNVILKEIKDILAKNLISRIVNCKDDDELIFRLRKLGDEFEYLIRIREEYNNRKNTPNGSIET